MAAEETYPKTGSVQAQKRAVFAKWLSGAYVKVWTKAADLLADVKRVAQNAGFTDMGDFTTKGLSSFLNQESNSNRQVTSHWRGGQQLWSIAPEGYVALKDHEVVVHRATFQKYKSFWKEHHKEVEGSSIAKPKGLFATMKNAKNGYAKSAKVSRSPAGSWRLL